MTLLPSVLLLLASLFLAQTAPATAQAAAERYELHFRLEARVEGLSLDAEIEAGGRLGAAAAERPGGGRSLVLTSVVEAPWKLYAVDPIGPGGEAKHAAVAVLSEVSWEALDAATAAFEELGRRRYRERPRSLPYDGAFTFVVLGAPEGRFRVDLDAEGRVTGVSNRLTDRWLSADFDALVAARREGKPVEGYWFWNAGARPPPWEPHTYHAFAAALELLGAPTSGDGETVRLTALGRDLAGLVETLAPRVAGRLPREGGVEAAFRSRPAGPGMQPGLRIVEGKGGGEALSYHRRRVVESSTGRVVEDVIEASSRGKGRFLKVEVGYRRSGEDG